MRVCIIGAGPSGLTTIKQVLDEGHEVTCFEKNDDIGGIWYRRANPEADAQEAKAYDNLILTISIKLMGFSDFMVEGDRVFYTHRQYREYLNAYAERYGLRRLIRLKSEVTRVHKNPDGTWQVWASTDGHSTEQTFDAVAVCSGPFQLPDKTSVPDLERFSGQVTHSSHYRNNTRFKGKRVLLVGLAESGADIVREVSDVASEATLSIRNYTFILPRLFAGRYATDAATVRFYHYEAYIRSQKQKYPAKALFGETPLATWFFMMATWAYGFMAHLLRLFSPPDKATEPIVNPLGEPFHPLKIDIGCEASPENLAAIKAWNRRSHNQDSTWTQQRIFCKNVSFIPNIVQRKLVVNDSGILRIEGHRVFFANGESREFDDIVLCTGFVKNFSVWGDDVAVQDDNVRNLYKHAFHPDHGGRLAYIGFVRPYTGGIPIAAEMQARYFALVCSDKLKLPANLLQLIKQEKEWEETIVCLSPRQTETVPSQALFIDSIAREIGCLMTFRELIWSPRLLVRHWFYPYNQAVYRIVGPHHMREQALRQVLEDKDGPLGAFWVQLGLFMLLSLPHFLHPKFIEAEGL